MKTRIFAGLVGTICLSAATSLFVGCTETPAERAKDRIENTAERQQEQVERNAEAQKDTVERNAENTKDAIEQNKENRKDAVDRTNPAPGTVVPTVPPQN